MTQYAANTLAHHWMPFTCNRDFKADPRLLIRGEGIYYWSHEGRRIIDATSGLFCCSAGHGRHEITQAVTKQLMEMDYAPSFQVGHPASFELARRIAAITPDGLNHVFFANSGSDAVDSALKIAMAYHCARGEGQRLRFVSRERSYHGMNIGGTSAGWPHEEPRGMWSCHTGSCPHASHSEPRKQFHQRTAGNRGGVSRGSAAVRRPSGRAKHRGVLCRAFGGHRRRHPGAAQRIPGTAAGNL